MLFVGVLNSIPESFNALSLKSFNSLDYIGIYLYYTKLEVHIQSQVYGLAAPGRFLKTIMHETSGGWWLLQSSLFFFLAIKKSEICF